MPITTALTVNEILNRVAVEVGLDTTQDPFSSTDRNFVQLRTLLNIAGEELAIMYDWNVLTARTGIDTTEDQSGAYALPKDFLRITNQTAWEHNNRVPVPMISPQEWSAMNGRNYVSDTIYPKYRLQNGLFTVYPQPTPPNYLISYEYISSGWVIPIANLGEQVYQDFITSRGLNLITSQGLIFQVIDPDSIITTQDIQNGDDLPVYDRTLITRYVKLKWLKAKGFDSQDAQNDFDQIFEMLTASNKGSKVLTAGRISTGVALINPYNNLSDSGYGI